MKISTQKYLYYTVLRLLSQKHIIQYFTVSIFLVLPDTCNKILSDVGGRKANYFQS